MSTEAKGQGQMTGTTRQVPVAWEALEDAFENNAPDVHSYLQLETGEVVRIVETAIDPIAHARISADPIYVRIDPVSSREQYRWMERFIASVDEVELRQKLVRSIDGKGAFRRFKDVLMTHPVERERWFVFRSERLKACMEAWLQAHGLEAVQRPEWRVPTAEEVRPQVELREQEPPAPRKSRADLVDALREKLHEIATSLSARDLDSAIAFLEFLRERRHLARARVRAGEGADRSQEEPTETETPAEAEEEEMPLGDPTGPRAEQVAGD